MVNRNLLIEVVNDFVAALKRSKYTQIAYKQDIVKFFDKLNLLMIEALGAINFSALVTFLQKHMDDSNKIELLESRQRVINVRTVIVR